MPAHAVEKALSAIEEDKSKVLGLSFKLHPDIQPGQFIPRAGTVPHSPLSLIAIALMTRIQTLLPGQRTDEIP